MLKNIFGTCAYSYSHGVDESCLGLVPIYYGLAYSLRSSRAVVLGSGGGIVPMAIRSAQRDLGLEQSKTWLIDGFVPEAGFGHPLEPGGWAVENSVLLSRFPEIEVVRKLSKDCRGLIEGIDFLHIDAEHTYEAVMEDYDVFKNSLVPGAVLTFHDTQDEGVQRAVAQIAEERNYDCLHLRDLASGLSILRKSAKDGYEKNVYDDCKTRPVGHRWTLGPPGGLKTWGSL